MLIINQTIRKIISFALICISLIVLYLTALDTMFYRILFSSCLFSAFYLLSSKYYKKSIDKNALSSRQKKWLKIYTYLMIGYSLLVVALLLYFEEDQSIRQIAAGCCMGVSVLIILGFIIFGANYKLNKTDSNTNKKDCD